MSDAAGAGGSSGSPASLNAMRREREGDRLSSNPASPRYVPSQLPSGDESSPRSPAVGTSPAAANGGGPNLGLLAEKAATAGEKDLLGRLDVLSRKAQVLGDWSDKKYGKVEAFPSSESFQMQLVASVSKSLTLD